MKSRVLDLGEKAKGEEREKREKSRRKRPASGGSLLGRQRIQVTGCPVR